MEKQTSLLWRPAHINEFHVNAPSSRWGHACCVVQNEIVIFGGYADSNYMNDMWAFNYSTLKWTEVKTTGDTPENRSNCTLNYDIKTGRIIVFGGGGPNKRRFNTIHILDWNTKIWTQLKPKQNSPVPIQRTYHTAEFKSNYLIVFGGQGHWDIDDLWIFDFQEQKWTQVMFQNDNKPAARRFHSSAIVGNQMYIIGGCYGKYRSLNTVYSLDLTQFLKNKNYSCLKWKQRKFNDASMLTRWGHSSSVFENKIYVFAGRFSNDLNDLLVMDVEAGTIKSVVKNSKQTPIARRRHCATFVGSSFVVFGGFNGQYFNDLHYINIQDSIKSWVIKSTLPDKITKFNVKNTSHHQTTITLKDGSKFSFSLELASRGFKETKQTQKILHFMQQKLTYQQANQFVKFASVGLGCINTQFYQTFSVEKMNQQKLDNKFYSTNLNKFLRQKVIQQSTLLVNNNNQSNGIIQIPIKLWEQALYKLQEGMDLNIEFHVENQVFMFSKLLLELNSVYFKNWLQFSEQRVMKINASSKIFSYILLFIATDYLIVPRDLTATQIVQIIKLSKIYNLKRLSSICQYRLFQIKSQVQNIFSIAIQNNLQNLKQFCAQQQIRKQFLCDKSNSLNVSPFLKKSVSLGITIPRQLQKLDSLKLTRYQSQKADCRRNALKKYLFDIHQTLAYENKLLNKVKRRTDDSVYEKENSELNS